MRVLFLESVTEFFGLGALSLGEGGLAAGLGGLGQVGGVDIATIVLGVLTAVLIAGTMQAFAGGRAAAAHERRKAIVKVDRGAMREAHISDRAARDREQRKARMLEDVMSKLKLEKQLGDQTLKLRLARAGIRRRPQIMIFLLLQVILPLVGVGVGLAAFHFALRPPEADWVLYACAGAGGAMLGYILPGMRVDSMAADRLKAIDRSLPDALDLLTICVEAGMSIEQSLARVAKEMGASDSILAEEIELLNAELAYLGDRRAAFDNFVRRTGAPVVKSVVSALVQAEKYGTPIGQALRVISAESRFNRMASAETKAAALPAKLTVPMMIFFVPALFIVILGPAILQMMEAF